MKVSNKLTSTFGKVAAAGVIGLAALGLGAGVASAAPAAPAHHHSHNVNHQRCPNPGVPAPACHLAN